ncbi:heat repeat-containing protein 6 [Phtheirospermum japonicum]|uniref:Heat repeat-containing protein 6 n=1 Tax=Phtheirospermum japonicum TaxID=374723 RepID=A0A830B931_9LAMI|nr:heat repeat-containing protein 6 [Phtheirospermum japonicum]
MSSAVKSWRTAFLTLRDESLGSPAGATIVHLLDQLILSQSDSLIAAAPDLPPHEVTSDFMLLMELARSISHSQAIEDVSQSFTKLSYLPVGNFAAVIHGISHYSFLEINSKSWPLVLDSFERIVQTLHRMDKTENVLIGNIAILKATKQCLESIRCLFGLYQAAALLSENEQLLTFLLQVVGYFQGESIYDNYTVCEVLTIAFAMIGEAYSRVGSSLPVDTWQSTVEVLRKVVDIVASKTQLLEDNTIAMFYIELLHCLHLVLTEPRGYLAGHVAGFVAALRIFFRYGLLNKASALNQVTNHKKEVVSTSKNPTVEVSNRSRSGPYRPPHLRKKVVGNQQCNNEDGMVSPKVEFISSDSECSDNDGSVIDNCGAQFAKARLAAILCIQDLCRADPKSFTAQWTMLLPSNDVLQHRKYETTLMSCLLFDPNLKVRIAAGSSIMALLDGPASVSLQDAGVVIQSTDASDIIYSVAAINCLTLALSVSPSSTHVNNMLLGEVSVGSLEGQPRSGVLYTLFRYSEQVSSPPISLEAFQVLDECLRAISGFKGIEDLSNDKFLDSPFTSDYMKTKAISSAPSYSLKSPASTEDESKTYLSASERWVEATTKHMPIIIKHSSAMVRAASVTCFAGMTSSVFFALPKDKQEFIISSSINAALIDEVPSVRSAACRAIGVIACFPQIYNSVEVLEKFIHAAEHNALDKLVSVRITASWALANICDSLSHCMDALHAGKEARKSSELVSLLVDSSLRLARDNDKVKANAVRALGNLARCIQFTSQPLVLEDPVDQRHLKIAKGSKGDVPERSDSNSSASLGSFDWLEQMVQAFLSCVTTGNVKVQWNVCHALSNLFFNKTLKLQDMDWSASVFSILLLLLRDSSNFKIRIQAAAALAVPETINDYGKSYYDVVKSVEHVVENFKSDQISEPSNFKYLVALEKQLTSTMLHLLSLAARSDHQATQDFLVKKASFLEVWIKDLCSSLRKPLDEVKHGVSIDQKRDVLFRTIRSLIECTKSETAKASMHKAHFPAGAVV